MVLESPATFCKWKVEENAICGDIRRKFHITYCAFKGEKSRISTEYQKQWDVFVFFYPSAAQDNITFSEINGGLLLIKH